MTKMTFKSVLLQILVFNVLIDFVVGADQESQNQKWILGTIMVMVIVISLVIMITICSLITLKKKDMNEEEDGVRSGSTETMSAAEKQFVRELRISSQSNVYRCQLKIYCGLHKPVGCMKYYHLSVLLLIFLSCIVLNIFEEALIDKYPKFRAVDRTDAEMKATKAKCIVDSLLIVILTFELTLRIWSSSCIHEYKGLKGKINYIKCHLFTRSLDLFGIITLMSFIIVHIYYDDVWLESEMRILHLFQLFQLYRLIFRIIKLMISTIWDQINQLYITTLFAILVLIFSAFCLYLVEKEYNDKIDNIYDAFWLTFITFNTIGYGDIYPETTFGKLLIGLCSIVGVTMFALPACIFGTGLALKVREEQLKSTLYQNPAAKLIQSIWRCYASNKKSKSIANWNLYNKIDNKPLNDKDKGCIRFIRLVAYLVARHHFKEILRISLHRSDGQYFAGQIQTLESIEENVNLLSYNIINPIRLQMDIINITLKKITSELDSQQTKDKQQTSQ